MDYKRYKRILTIVIDSVGVGHAPDADRYRSAGADTLGHIAEYFVSKMNRPLAIPNLVSLGITETHPGGLAGITGPAQPRGAFGRMQVISYGNDSLDGHWEMVCLPARFHVDYFPDACSLVRTLDSKTGQSG